MEVTRRELLKGAAALGAAGALSHALPGSAQAQTTQKKELVVAQGGDIARFDPHYSTSSNDIRVSFNIYDNLTSRHPDGKLHPGLATEWKLTGPTTWTFKLRSGVKFHHGDPFSSADAKFSIERTYDPNAKTMVATALATIDKIETPDATTLAVNSKRPPLANPLVKQALSLAIDREAIVKELWRGRGIVPSQPIAKGDNHWDASLPPLPYKPTQARDLLKKAGYKNEEIIIE